MTRQLLSLVLTAVAVSLPAADRNPSLLTSADRTAGAAPQRKFGPGVCGPADPVYLKSATETGGQPFFLSPAEVSSSARIMGASSHGELILWASANVERAYTVPVDPSIERAMFSASFDGTGGALSIVSPAGIEVQQDARIEDTHFNCGRIVTIDAPAPGTWLLKVRPSQRFWLVARAKSDLSLIAAEFVQPGGRPGHEGLFRIQGQPIARQPAMIRVKLSSPIKDPMFEFVSVDAHSFHRVDLKSLDDGEFVGRDTIPEGPFRVMATGRDESGALFQRVSAPLFHGEPIEVVPPARDTVVAGTTTRVTFMVRNLGPAISLVLIATDGHGNVLAVEPATLQLDSRTEGNVAVRLAIPADASSDRDASVLLTASGSGSSSAMNYARKQFTVIPREKLKSSR